jgi:hypothetical protein
VEGSPEVGNPLSVVGGVAPVVLNTFAIVVGGCRRGIGGGVEDGAKGAAATTNMATGGA